MRIASTLPLVCLIAFTSCQSMSSGVISLEARALVLDDAELDDIESGSGLDEEDIDVEGYGLHGAFMTPILDVVAGVEQREFGDEDAPEFLIGLRRRFLEFWRLHPFVEGNVRYGFDFDNGVQEDDYFGWQLGVGSLLDITDHFFLNLRLMYETTELDLPSGGSTDLDGLVGTFGIGFSF